MGIVNVTPDSFADGGVYGDVGAAIDHGRRLTVEGADIVDVGGESSRPGAEPVDEATELARVIPVVEALADEVRVSVDTAKAGVARAAISAGATIVNDISATLHEVAAEGGVGWVAMHMQGRPATMQDHPTYTDVVAEVTAYLVDKARRAAADGVSEVWIDPGIGFGKNAGHNWELLAGLSDLTNTGWPVVIGTSRKGFLGRVLGHADGGSEPTPVTDRLEGSLATATHAAACGVGMLRVHDVAATVGALRAVAA